MVKKHYQAGDTLVMRIRKNDLEIMEWAAKQSSLGESIRYLIEQEIQSHGSTDLALEIASTRTILPTALDIEPELLQLLSDNETVTTAEAYEKLAEKFLLGPEALKALVRNGSEPQWSNNVRWAQRFLKDKNYSTAPTRGVWQITEEGRKFIKR